VYTAQAFTVVSKEFLGQCFLTRISGTCWSSKRLCYVNKRYDYSFCHTYL
jgi:hypothetical protein